MQADALAERADLEARPQREQRKLAEALLDEPQVEAVDAVERGAPRGAVEVHAERGLHDRAHPGQRLLERAPSAHAVAQGEADAVALRDGRADLDGSGVVIDAEERNREEVLLAKGLAGAGRDAERDEGERTFRDAGQLGEARERLHGGLAVELEERAALSAGDERRRPDGLVRLRYGDAAWRKPGSWVDDAHCGGVADVVLEEQPALGGGSTAGEVHRGGLARERSEQALQRRRRIDEHEAQRARARPLRGGAQLVRLVGAPGEDVPLLLERKDAERGALLA